MLTVMRRLLLQILLQSQVLILAKMLLRSKEIENEKNAQLFNMFDQKMKEVQ